MIKKLFKMRFQKIWVIVVLAMSACANPHSSKIVFDKLVTPSDSPSAWGHTQIMRMDSDGSNPINLSNRNRSEYMPNVSPDGKQIVFISNGTLHLMNVDGFDMKVVPNSPGKVSNPKWNRGTLCNYILFAYPYASDHSAIYRIKSDGSDLIKLTNPPPKEWDDQAVFIDDQHIVFSRRRETPPTRSGLYVKNIKDDSPEGLLISAPPNSAIYFPVVSHNGKKLAYRFVDYHSMREWIRIAEFAGPKNVVLGKDLIIASPASWGISGIDFSINDQELIVSMEASDVDATQIGRRQEIFKISLDGSNQIRLTNNSDLDRHPSVIP